MALLSHGAAGESYSAHAVTLYSMLKVAERKAIIKVLNVKSSNNQIAHACFARNI